MARNYEYIQVSKMAAIYKVASTSYIQEALLFYLEHKQSVHIESNSATNPLMYELTPFADFFIPETGAEAQDIHKYLVSQIESHEYGCGSQLWDEAVEWAASHHFHSWIFRNWWVRAALARGHTEWLLKERLADREPGHFKPVEPWRLVWPGVVGQYDNSCVVYTTLIVTRHAENHPWYEDDEYGTVFAAYSEL